MSAYSSLNSPASPGNRDVEMHRPGRAAWPAWLAIGAMLLAAAGCGGGGGGSGGGGAMTPPPSGGDGGGGGAGNDDDYVPPGGDDGDGGDGGGTDTLQPTLASIQDNVFTPVCTQCHAGAAAPQGLRLEEGMSYAMLVNVASVEVPELLRVDPGNPDDSYIIHKLEGTNAVGERMPLGGPYLSQETIDVIRQWITDGAAQTAGQPADQGKTMLTGAWPEPGSTLAAAPSKIMLIADAELDTSLLHAGSVQIFKRDDIDPMTGQPRRVENAAMRITSLSPTVITFDVPVDEWAPGEYEVRVDGTGALAVADRSGRVIDGDGDGKPGGDFVMRFDVERAR